MKRILTIMLALVLLNMGWTLAEDEERAAFFTL